MNSPTPTREELLDILLEILKEYDDHSSIAPVTWQKACDLLRVSYGLEPLK